MTQRVKCRVCGDTPSYVQRMALMPVLFDFKVYGNDSEESACCLDIGCCLNPDGDKEVDTGDSTDADQGHMHWHCSSCGATAENVEDLLVIQDEDDSVDGRIRSGASEGRTAADVKRERMRAKGLL